MQPHLFSVYYTTSSQKLNKGIAVGSSENLGEPPVTNYLFLLLFSFLYLQNFGEPWPPLAPSDYGPEGLKDVLGFI